MAVTKVAPDTRDEKRLLRQCTVRAAATPDLTEAQRLNAITFDYNTAVLKNVENADDGTVRTLNLRGAITKTLLKTYWAGVSKHATVALRGSATVRVRGPGRGAGGGRGAEKGIGAGGGRGEGRGGQGQEDARGTGRGGANRPRPVDHASRVAQGSEREEVFTMTDEAIDGLGTNELKRVLRRLEGEFGGMFLQERCGSARTQGEA